jgi:hypothetical protein
VPQEILEVKECFASGSSHRNFRNFIRRLPDNCPAVVKGDFPKLCSDGSHQSRPGKTVAHSDLAELFNEWSWAAGILAKRGGVCGVESSSRLFAGSVILANMAKAPGEIVFGDEI